MKQARRRFGGISRQRAIRMVSRAIEQQIAASATCYAVRPPWCRALYHREIDEPCWYIVAPWNDGLGSHVLRSSRVIVMGRRNGVIYYDGSAGDEG